jgi:ribosomal protein S18 acetylase RimI-like enzyme
MTSHHPSPPRPLERGLPTTGPSLRPETPADAAFLAELFAAVRGKAFAALGWDDSTLRGFLATQQQFQARHYAAAYPGASNMVIMRNGKPAGRLILRRGASDIRVVDIALLPHHQGDGLGTALLRMVQEQAADLRATVSLAVSRDNPAHHLYRRLGFTETGGTEIVAEMRWHPPP